MATDAILNIYMNITEGIVVYERVIARRVMEKLPFMATENILMESVKRGGDRQELHEALRVHSHAAAARVKLEGGQNDLLDRIAADPLFPLSREELEEMLDPRAFIGCCPSQVTRFLKDTVQPVVDRWGAKETLTAKLEVLVFEWKIEKKNPDAGPGFFSWKMESGKCCRAASRAL